MARVWQDLLRNGRCLTETLQRPVRGTPPGFVARVEEATRRLSVLLWPSPFGQQRRGASDTNLRAAMLRSEPRKGTQYA